MTGYPWSKKAVRLSNQIPGNLTSEVMDDKHSFRIFLKMANQNLGPITAKIPGIKGCQGGHILSLQACHTWGWLKAFREVITSETKSNTFFFETQTCIQRNCFRIRFKDQRTTITFQFPCENTIDQFATNPRTLPLRIDAHHAYGTPRSIVHSTTKPNRQSISQSQPPAISLHWQIFDTEHLFSAPLKLISGD